MLERHLRLRLVANPPDDPQCPGEWSAIAIGVLGVAGRVFTALKFNRDHTTAIVSQQTQMLDNMRTLSAELRTQRDEAPAKRDDFKTRVGVLTGKVEALRS